jgi:glycosyltransferase involved in cell wall biosynthesis
MNKEPLVSIIVPAYNTGKYIEKCLNSITSQSYQNLEIIVVDDGSTDNTGEIIDKCQKKDARIISVRKKNGGQGSARNTGLSLCKGDFIGFMDSDDEYAEGAIEEYVAAAQKSNGGLAVSGVQYKRLKLGTVNDVYINKIRAKRANESLAKYVLFLLTIDGRMYSSTNKLFDGDIIRKNKLTFPEDVAFAEDSRFVLNYLKKMHGEITFILKPLYVYNFGTSGSTVSTTGIKWENWKMFYEFLQKWVGKANAGEKFWLKAVLARWRVSYIRTLRRARK